MYVCSTVTMLLTVRVHWCHDQMVSLNMKHFLRSLSSGNPCSAKEVNVTDLKTLTDGHLRTATYSPVGKGLDHKCPAVVWHGGW